MKKYHKEYDMNVICLTKQQEIQKKKIFLKKAFKRRLLNLFSCLPRS